MRRKIVKYNIYNMSLINRLKLAKMLLQFGTLLTDSGTLHYEGDLVEGLEVFIEQEGELIPAPDGEYKTEDVTVTVVGGRIETLVEKAVEEEKPEEETTTELETLEEETPTAEIEALKEENEKLKAEIEELKKQLEEANEKLNMSVEKPAHVEVKDVKLTKENKAMKYFA